LRRIDALSGLALALAVAALIGCAGREKGIHLGQEIHADGAIKTRGLDYHFKPAPSAQTPRQLFNRFYFQGDTICFSMDAGRNLHGCRVTARFSDPASGRSFPAERLEISGSRVWGFSLVGSLMDGFFRDELDAPLPPSRYEGRRIPFAVEIDLDCREGGPARYTVNGSFSIGYLP
jgi:hypothetical protein